MQVNDDIVRAYKVAFNRYMSEVALGITTPPSPDVGFHASKHALTAALAHTWRPIDAKAKNGGDHLVYNEEWDWTFGAVQIARWDDGVWQFQSDMCLDDDDEEGLPTHYMPLPAPPKTGGE